MLRLFLCALICFPAITSAQQISATDPQSIILALQNQGYRAEVKTDSAGDPLILSATSGVNFAVYFYGCRDNTNCRDVQFSASFDLSEPLTASAMNVWNSEKLIGKASIDDEGDPFIRMFVPGFTSVSGEDFARIINRWDQGLTDFVEFIGW